MLRSKTQRQAVKNRSYDAVHAANSGKEAAVAGLLPHWQRGLVHMQHLQVRRLRNGDGITLVSTTGMPGYLSQRQWKSVVNQVNGGLRSWAQITVAKMRPLISSLPVSDDEKHRLRKLNLAHKWWVDPTLRPLVSKLARTSHPFPNFSRVRTMNMDGIIATRELSNTGTFRWWVRISLTPGSKPVRIPLRSNPYLDSQEGDLRNFCQIRVSSNGRVSIRLVKASPKENIRTEGRVIGVDWGLKTLLTTSDGERLGQRLYPWLLKRDQELIALQRSLQQQGIRPNDSQRYRNLISRVRDYVANEVGRVVRRLQDEDIREIVVERLDFRFGGLSKRLNRIMSMAGRSAVSERLAALSENTGILITEVSSSYTSQTCSGCGYTSKSNRTSQSQFRCWFCNKTINADVNAARNIRQRRSLPVADPYTSRQTVLEYLDQQFASRWGHTADRVSERQSRPYSRATPRRKPGGQRNSVSNKTLRN